MVAIQMAESSSRMESGAGFTTSFLYVYSPHVSQAWPRAIRSARSREMLVGKVSDPVAGDLCRTAVAGVRAAEG